MQELLTKGCLDQFNSLEASWAMANVAQCLGSFSARRQELRLTLGSVIVEAVGVVGGITHEVSPAVQLGDQFRSHPDLIATHGIDHPGQKTARIAGNHAQLVAL